MKAIIISLFLILFISIHCEYLYSQADTSIGGIQIQLFAQKKAQVKYVNEQNRLQRIANKIRKNTSFRLPPSTIDEIVNNEALNKYTLKEYFNSLTEESRAFVVEFVNTKNPLGIDFSVIYKMFEDSTFNSIQNWYKLVLSDSINKIVQSSNTNSANSLQTKTDISFHEDTTMPYLFDLSFPLIITKNFTNEYSNQYRDIISTPNCKTIHQSIFLRGRYEDSEPPYFPDYKNLQCENCCGPAAGESILEWWNVPVKDSYGVVIHYPKTIQGKLSEEMKTEDGFDYTPFFYLVNVLCKDKYKADKLIKVTFGDGDLTYILDQLIQGSPVILLLAWGDKMHYATVYGYSSETDEFLLANMQGFDSRLSSEQLWTRWNWSTVNLKVRYLLSISGHLPYSSFSYCPDNMPVKWVYKIPLVLKDISTPGKQWFERYFEVFNEEYVGTNENQLKLNFYARLGFDFSQNSLLPKPYVSVSSCNNNVELGQGNSHIVFSPDYSDGKIENNSRNKEMDLRIFADTVFMMKHMRKLSVQWKIKDRNGTELWSGVNTMPNDTIGNNFVFEFPKVKKAPGFPSPLKPLYYAREYSTIEFSIGGGFRKLTFELLPCNYDYDDDGICDEFDEDMDNDGVPNEKDNCVKGFNPYQTDNDKDGIGYYCDCDEKCERNICSIDDLSFLCPSGCEKLLCTDLEIYYLTEFLEEINDLRNYWPVKRIQVNPFFNPRDILNGKIAYWFLKRKVNKLINQYDNPLINSPEVKDKIIQGLLFKSPNGLIL